MKIGLYFGSFNPIHIGHLIIANHVANYTDVDQVWLVVSPRNPLKLSSLLLNEYSRLHLVKIAVEDNLKIKASDVEFKLPKPSYTIDTLTYLKERYPTNSFSVIMGSDSFRNIGKWKNFEILLKNYSLIIYPRPNFPIQNEKISQNIRVLNAPLLEISATAIREAVKNNKSIRYLVSDNVCDEIENAGYYK
ncbi:MAG: nicotinate-nucleotide adenylyltransferase [Pedobacter sp.]|nr:nicotinate-nucleotide adenylyltransferase [Chitinophagaceae bacterium]